MEIAFIIVFLFFTGSEDYTFLFRFLTYKYLKDYENEITSELMKNYSKLFMIIFKNIIKIKWKIDYLKKMKNL